MPGQRFHFGPQPALDRAISRREQCEQALAEARQEFAREQGRLAELKRIQDELRGRVREMLDRLERATRSGASSEALDSLSRFIASLNLLERANAEAVAGQEEQVRWAGRKVAMRAEELSQAMASVESLKNLKEQAHVRHRKEKARHQDQDREESVALYRTHGRTRHIENRQP